AGTPKERIHETVEWLWQEQPKYNLWRRPIAGMFELVRELHDMQIPLGIISNSEGRLAELADELGIGQYFRVVADSGKFGIPKPKAEIFLYTAQSLGVKPTEIVHVGDALAADVEGALNVGMRVIWFAGDPDQRTRFGEDVRLAFNAADVREALRAWLGR
ncbi:MAG TPA: HAD-IA family hydrolase, partial [Polyangiaceae bacterium]|nr:HAD-IA family hydrolase [Polyangiaceae bacterium]